MRTIVETELFTRQAARLWSEEERGEFCIWLAQHPDAGDLVPGSGGCRKIRWRRAGSGKSGGVRVITFQKTADGRIFLLMIYAKSVRGNVPAHIMKAVAEAIENGQG
jgi:hypothetical protein